MDLHRRLGRLAGDPPGHGRGQVGQINRSQALRSRAAQTLALFMIALLSAIMLGVPDQPQWTVGAELTAVGLIGAVVVFILDRRAQRDQRDDPLLRVFEVYTPATTTSVLVVASGLSLMLGWAGGIYLLVPGVVVAITGGVVNAWLFLVRASIMPPAER